MPWFHVDDNLYGHPKAQEVGLAAIGLWTMCGSWSAHYRKDGFVPAEVVRKFGTKRLTDRLLTSGLWEQVDGGYLFHDWDHCNSTESQRNSAARRQADHRKRGNVTPRVTPAVTPKVTPAVTPAVTPVSQPSHLAGARTRPLTNTSLVTSGGEVTFGNARDSNGARPADAAPPPCPKHGTNYDHDEPCRHCAKLRRWNQASEQRANQQRAERDERHRIIDNCPLCDDRGQIDLVGVGQTRCEHGRRAPDGRRYQDGRLLDPETGRFASAAQIAAALAHDEEGPPW